MRRRKRLIGLSVATVGLVTFVFILASGPHAGVRQYAPGKYEPHKGPPPAVYSAGALLAMTGYGSYYGQVQGEGMEAKINFENDKGELPFKLKLIKGDHGTDNVQMSQNAARKLTTVDKVAWINSTWPGTLYAASPICAQVKVPIVNSGGYVDHKKVLEYEYTYNSRLTQTQFAPPLPRYLVQKGIKRLAHMYYNDVSGILSAKMVAGVGKKLGLEIVYDEPYTPPLTDFRASITKMIATKPDAIAAYCWGPDPGYFVKQARELGWKGPIVGFDYAPVAMEIGGAKNFEGYIYAADIWIWNDSRFDKPLSREMVASFKKYWKYEPKGIDLFAANAYECVSIMVECIKYVLAKGGDPFSGFQMRQAILDKKNFDTIFPGDSIEIRPDGLCYKPTFVFEVKGSDGKAQIVHTEMRPEPWEQ